MDLSAAELLDESDPIAGLEPIGPVDEVAKGKQTWRYRFPEQDFDLGRGTVYEPRRKAERPDEKPSAWVCGDVVGIDVAASTIDIRRVPGDPHPEAIVPLTIYQTPQHRARLLELGTWVAEHGIDADGPHRAARDLLMSRPARAGQGIGDPLRAPGELDLHAARRLALTLDRTILPIQGPPGTGKTYGGARMILTLLQAGRRVGITGMSHKVIGNLLGAVLQAAEEEGVDVLPVQHGDVHQVLADERVVRGNGAADVAARLADGRSNLAAGTSWLWVSPTMLETVDVLFVDEAGQNSLANVVAMAAAAESVVLLGDPQQLDQPLQGSHPPGAERSALAHVLGSASTVPPDRGLFFETTWRLHPTLTAFTSEVFYDDRLESEARLVVQRILDAPAGLDGTGLRLVEVASAGADNESPTEAAAVAALVTGLIEAGASWIDQDGVQRPLDLEGDPRRGAVQRAGRRDREASPAGGPGRYRRQVPGPGGACQRLLPHDVQPGARPARDGLPVQPKSTQRRDVQGPLHRDRRGVPGPVARPGANARPDAPGERVLSVRRTGDGRAEDGRADGRVHGSVDRRPRPRRRRGPDARPGLTATRIIA